MTFSPYYAYGSSSTVAVSETAFRYVTTSETQAELVSIPDMLDHAVISASGNTAFDATQKRKLKKLIRAAANKFKEITGKRILKTSYRATLECIPWAYVFELRDLPVITIDKIFGLDTDDSENVIATTEYTLDPEMGQVILVTPPSSDRTLSQFNIEYSAGYTSPIAGTLKTAITAASAPGAIVLEGMTTTPELDGIITLTNASTGVRESFQYDSFVGTSPEFTFNIGDVTIDSAFLVGDVSVLVSPPEDIQEFIMQTVAHWYEHREAATQGSTLTSAIQDVPQQAVDLIWQYKTQRG